MVVNVIGSPATGSNWTAAWTALAGLEPERVGRATLSRTMDMTVPVVALPRIVRFSAVMNPRRPTYQKKLATRMPKSAAMAVVLSPLARPIAIQVPQTGPAYVSSDCHRQGHDCMELSTSRGRPALQGDGRATTADRDGFQVVRAIPDSRLAGAKANRGCVPLLRTPPVVDRQSGTFSIRGGITSIYPWVSRSDAPRYATVPWAVGGADVPPASGSD